MIMTETSCHQSNSPIAILMARSIIANPDRMARVSQIFRFTRLLNMTLNLDWGFTENDVG